MNQPKAFENPWIYHREIKQTDNFVAKITGPPKRSTKGNEYVPIVYRGDGNRYMIFPEHDEYMAALVAAPRNVWLRFDAAGYRDSATIMLVPLDGAQAPSGVSTETGEIVQQEIVYEPEPEYTYDSLMDAWMQALATANDIQDWFKIAFEREMTDNDRRLANSLLISQEHSNYRVPLASMKPAPESEPEFEPEDGGVEDDLPFE